MGPLQPGTLVVKPIRHVLRVAELDPDETAELGPLLQRCTAALTRVLEPSQVYVCLWSHPRGEPVHLHFVLQPVHSSTVEQFQAFGPALQAAMFAAGELPPENLLTEICDRLRDDWRGRVPP